MDCSKAENEANEDANPSVGKPHALCRTRTLPPSGICVGRCQIQGAAPLGSSGQLLPFPSPKAAHSDQVSTDVMRGTQPCPHCTPRGAPCRLASKWMPSASHHPIPHLILPLKSLSAPPKPKLSPAAGRIWAGGSHVPAAITLRPHTNTVLHHSPRTTSNLSSQLHPQALLSSHFKPWSANKSCSQAHSREKSNTAV